MYDLIIVGGGPAGVAAAVYAARKRLKTLLVVDEWGGQSNVSLDVQNWIGTKSITGTDLAKKFREHIEAYKDNYIEILSSARATALDVTDGVVQVRLAQGKKETTAESRALLIASGARRRTLTIPGAKEFDQKGLTYCASCDGPLFADKDVVVIGGGNAGFETALQLLAYCKSVTLLHRDGVFKADEVTIAAAIAHKNMRALLNAEPMEIVGETFVTGLKWKDTKTGKEEMLPVEGIFVEIGLLPNTEWIGDKLEKNAIGQIKVDHKSQRTSHPRVWAAGDVTDGLYHQNNIAAGDAVKALEDIYMTLRRAKND
ncbi:FAD-dependent oxidoreductase [Candidatus Kaiserbacteria bacterium]|nr:FAD-dependent oxidoreductase [Candidatus Kaiserbacteria bacterium]